MNPSAPPAVPAPSHSPRDIAPLEGRAAEPRGVTSILFPLTVFLSAFLLFLIEPLFAKLILPWFGGSAAVWATCLVFFQSALLLGYLYADLTTRHLAPARQSLLHIGLLVLSFLLLPIAPHPSWRPHPGDEPAWRILGLLTASIGLPFVLLSATSPLVQTWFARRRGATPYHLFALSNLASFVALLSYPFFIEPRMHAQAQTKFWSALFAVFAAICSLAAWLSRARKVQPSPESASAEAFQPPGKRAVLLWLSLSACGSMLLLSITNHLTQNVAPIPLLWVLPLALYLLTFAMAFSRRSLYSRWLMVRLLAVMLGGIGYAIYDPSFTYRIQVSVPLFCTGLFVCCLFCHGELSRLKPAPQFLTTFYLMVSLGGALGAIFVGLVAPHLFRNVYEFPATLLLTAGLALAVLWPEGWLVRGFWASATVAMAVLLFINIRFFQRDALLMVRSFYGALRIKQFEKTGSPAYRGLYHGRIEHGSQALAGPLRLQPTTYYGPDSGVGLALRLCCGGPKRVGVIGLGVGTLAAYGKRRDSFRFYEINSQVVDIARRWFTYLQQSPAQTQIAFGDARLSLENEPPQQFDVLAVDAFSGDAIPVHLLTREAMSLYLRHLKPSGILAFHTSNAYLNLAPVVWLLADDVGYRSRLIVNDADDDRLIDRSDWVLVTRNEDFLRNPATLKGSEEITIPSRLRPWSDDDNSLFSILRPVKFSSNNSK